MEQVINAIFFFFFKPEIKLESVSPGGRRVSFITYMAVTVREGVKGEVIMERNGRRHMWLIPRFSGGGSVNVVRGSQHVIVLLP